MNLKKIITQLLKKSILFLRKVLKYILLPIFGKLVAFFRHRYYKLKWGKSTSEPYKLIYVNPKKIDFLFLPYFKSVYSIEGTYIKDGDWDLRKKNPDKIIYHSKEIVDKKKFVLLKLNKYWLFQSFKSHFVHDIPWEHTHSQKRYQKNNYHNMSKDKVTQAREKSDILFNKIKTHGYKTQRELLQDGDLSKLPFRAPEYDEVVILIGRDGEMFLDTRGRHRLFIAKILEIPKVPVRVLVRHKKWQEKRYQIVNTTLKELPKKYKKYLSHPDMQDIIDKNN